MSGGEKERGRRDGPVPVRDLLRGIAPDTAETPAADDAATDAASGAAADAGAGSAEQPGLLFEMDGELWSARPAGVGAYGTGRTGAARLLAVHFHRQDAPDVPVREALVPAARFPTLDSEGLRELFGRATPIELER